MKFVMSYSCGKDSTLALHKMIATGHTPVGLCVISDKNAGRSFFHGVDQDMLQRYAEALKIPLILCPTDGANYHIAMEDGLCLAIAKGAEAACFGDIDIAENRKWAEERCTNVGLTALFPLWHNDRRANVSELIDLGYKCLIKSINTDFLPADLAGKFLDADTVKIISECGIDICGENGEYHTIVVDGPIFHHPLPYTTGKLLRIGNRAIIEVF